MKQYLMYLRKSRLDTDYEEISVAETLSRHRVTLEKFCRSKRLHVAEVLEEVVSGESLSARPQMLRLLELVSTGKYAGVVCMDIERLSRGSSMESGYIMQVFQVNGCQIITPGKTYDLQNESDEQFTDLKFMFSRYELKTINSRLVRGRNHSASEGKYMGSMAPYGYRVVKLPGEKGNSLRVEPEEAKVVCMIYDMYGQQGMGYNAIAYKLNDLHIPARKSKWGQTSIVNILNNEVYLGKIRWRHEPSKRVIKDGILTKKRVINDDCELYDGRHEPIITQEQWDLVRAAQAKKNHNPVNIERQLQNPFAGILVCGKCGATMKRTVPDKNRNPTPWYRCSSRGCDCKIIKCATVETAICNAMKEWLENYTIQLKNEQQSKTDPIETALESVRGQLASLQAQQDTICEYLEKGIYTIEMFTKRNSTLSTEIKNLQSTEAGLLQQKRDGGRKDQMAEQIIPITQQILDSYPILTPAEKNRLWKLVMKRATVYRSQDDTLSVHIYPNLPK